MRSALFAALLLAIVPVSGSEVESGSDEAVTYQLDADTDHDAPDLCSDLLSHPHQFRVPLDGSSDGMLLPPDDTTDHFQLGVTPVEVGDRLFVYVAPTDTSVQVDIDVLTPGCGSSVMAAENQPAAPHNPPAPGPGEQQATLHNGHGGWDCDSTQWFFVLNQMGGHQAPASIRVTWTNGAQEDVPLLQATPATTAHYATTSNLGYTVAQATANVPVGWSGKLNIGAGPCNAVDGQATFGEPNEDFGAALEYTPLLQGDYILVVTWVPPTVPEVPTSIPVSCHTGCAGPGTQPVASLVSYSIGYLRTQ